MKYGSEFRDQIAEAMIGAIRERPVKVSAFRHIFS